MDEWLGEFSNWIFDEEKVVAQAHIFLEEVLPCLTIEVLQKIMVSTIRLQAKKLNSFRKKAIGRVRKNYHYNHCQHPCNFCGHMPHVCKGSR